MHERNENDYFDSTGCGIIRPDMNVTSKMIADDFYDAQLARIQTGHCPQHWVCFECRKMFKRLRRRENSSASVRAVRCPECREPMRNMGVYFEPPRKVDKAGWCRMKLIADFGYGFHSEGAKAYIKSSFLGNPPASLRELRRRLLRDPNDCTPRRRRLKALELK